MNVVAMKGNTNLLCGRVQ